MDFVNKVIIVTGASSGIGAETAVQFAQQSAKVVLVGRNEENLNKYAEQCLEARGIEPLVVRADVTNDSDVRNIVEETVKRFGQIDVLVNNAGIGAMTKIQDGVDIFDKVFNTNIRSVYLLTSLAVPYLIKNKGNIVNISSVSAQKVIPQFSVYGASKAALDRLTKGLALELAPHGVRVNAISPGPVKTGAFAASGADPEVVIKSREKSSPLGRVAVSRDIADMVLYLAGSRAVSITGSVYVIDNGRLLE